jgi:sedoheptulose-bisphosphatase
LTKATSNTATGHTGISDIPLTANGEKRIKATGRAMIGKDRLIVPEKLAHIYISPRKRAQRTFELLGMDLKEPLPWKQHGSTEDTRREGEAGACEAKIEVTEAVREWDYGEYEGITSAQIKEIRKEKGQSLPWDIWKDGCPGGE